MRLPLLIALLALAAALAGCGSDDAPPSASARPSASRCRSTSRRTPSTPRSTPPRATAATAARASSCEIRKPGPGPDALKLITAGKVDLGVLDIHDLAIAREQGADLVAIGALVDKPLAALIGQPGLKRPRDLEGRTVGVSGLPSDPAFLRAILEHDGADYDSVKQVTIGFSAVARLLSRRVDAVPAFWNAEGVALKAKGRDVSEFRVDDYGAPPYPEVVLVTSRRTLEAERDTLRRTLKAIAGGMDATLADPRGAAREIADAAESERRRAHARAARRGRAGVRARAEARPRRARALGRLRRARSGSSSERPDVDRAFDLDLAG